MMFRGLPLPKGRHCDNAESFKALQARYGKKRRDSSVRRPTKHRSMIRVLDCLWRPGPGKVVDVEATQRLRLVQLSRVIGSLLEDSLLSPSQSKETAVLMWIALYQGLWGRIHRLSNMRSSMFSTLAQSISCEERDAVVGNKRQGL